MQKRSILFLGLAAFAFAPLLAEADASYLLQLGSFPTETAATERWNALKAEYNGQLEGLDMRISNVPIGGGKSIYRLQAGPMNSKETAASRCATLKAAKQDCYLVETAVLSNEAPKQALSAVRASDSSTDGELQLGKSGNESDGLITLDTALPRAKESADAKPVSSASLAEPVASSKPNAPEVISPDKAPPAPLEDSLRDDVQVESTASVPASPGDEAILPDRLRLSEDAQPLEAPLAASAHTAPTVHFAPEKTAASSNVKPADALQSLAERPDGYAQADNAKSMIAPATSPMGSLGTLRMSPQGEVIGSTGPLAQTIAKAAAPTAPAAASAPIAMAAPALAPASSARAISAPASIALLMPPAPSISASQAPQTSNNFAPAPLAAPIAAAPAMNAATPLASSSGTLQLPASRNGQVLVKEAVRVHESREPVDPLTPPTGAYGEHAQPRPASAAAAVIQQPQEYSAPAAWRGTPSDNTQGMAWAQFGKFTDEPTAFAFFDNLRAQRPDLTNAVRVRALRPYSAVGASRSVTLRVGPYRNEAEVNALCGLLAPQNIPCDSIREMGAASFNAGGPRQADVSLNRPGSTFAAPAASPFVAPGNHWVQLGTFGSDREAYNRYSSLKANYPKLFTSTQPNVSVPKANSSARPAHRLRVGPFMDETAARGFCNSLGKNGIPCLIVNK